MDTQQFREFGKAAVDYIADYFETIRDRPVLPSVEPGYLGDLLPKEPPQTGESWQDVLQDVDRIIMPGLTHWHSPKFHAFYPTANSFPAVVGEMLSAGFGCVGLSWIASPAYTELEVVMMNWLGKLLDLPEEFLNSSEGPGGGIIQGSASEVTFIGLLAAKEKKVKDLMEQNPDLKESDIKGKLVAYTSDQSNSSVEKAGLLGSMPMRLIPSNDEGQLSSGAFIEAIRKDKEAGLIPCYLVACLGTTPTCAFDDLTELGPICNRENIWLHVDAAYAGAAFACPEYRYLMKGVEYADSFNFNPHKWMLVNFDCSAMWVKNAKYLVEAFNVQRIYLKDQHKDLAPEYRHWQISLGRRFRALKLWFVLKIYGVEGIQKYIRDQIGLAKKFEELVNNDNRFEVCTSSMGLVTFRLKGEDSLTKSLLEKIDQRKNIFMVPGHFKNKFVLRFVICSRLSTEEDVKYSWEEIRDQADEVVPTERRKIVEEISGKRSIATIELYESAIEKIKLEKSK
ncbi:aromatic-L-amino-acid decarboxylase-like isoform X2 [Diorhabda carinulata]|uniref:aromatic-L-amino-acid decarboxylase-like isoform X2 n=1 Tax=Diorhabda carinulata TaxID=1163345 RepID=UPI0025A11C0E|nr:aromatic-L-amino-acid decarboxylase-like isoform X2 [Diorhabda carinulata]